MDPNTVQRYDCHALVDHQNMATDVVSCLESTIQLILKQ